MTYDFYVLLKFITQHKFNIKLPVDNNGKEKQLALFTINNPELDELKKLPKAPTAKTVNTNNTNGANNANNAEQKPKRTRAKKNVELPPVVNNQEPQEENNQNDIQNEPQGENIQNEPQEEPQ